MPSCIVTGKHRDRETVSSHDNEVTISKFFVIFWPLIIGLFVLIFVIFQRWHKTDVGKIAIDKLILRLPIFGKLIRNVIMTEFTRNLGLQIGSGTLVVSALRQSAESTGNIIYETAIKDIAKRVEKGVPMGAAMQAYELFPYILIQMVKIGEETGKLDDSLLRVSEYFQREVDQRVKTLTTALEPLIMLVLGIGVAFIIISIITPIYNLTNVIK